ncbi:hypothetical protein MTR67_001832 [Solanum verrucosum]|uniref:RNase H type-1 domain-containing protein n=1 Tax=Solanum verrucosum TaxID=315347 RepID=A0AAF0PPW7_SOLVR|nr:hypothetical protein MTR67_001832 [Solanum verrucosum]
MEVHIPWNIKEAISTAFRNYDTTGTWAELCARMERYKPIVRWRLVRWMKPDIGKIKANTYASFIHEKSRAGIGGIIRDATVANMIKDKDTKNLKLKGIIRDIDQAMNGAEANISHCYREANQTADFFAKHASSSGSGAFCYSFHQFPKEVKEWFEQWAVGNRKFSEGRGHTFYWKGLEITAILDGHLREGA